MIKEPYEQRHISLAGSDHWNSKLSTNIQCNKNNQSVFLIFFLKSARKSTKKLYFWHIWGLYRLLTKLQIILAAAYVVLFLPDCSNCFFMYNTMHPYLFLLFSHFVFLFSPSLSYSSHRETHSTSYNVSYNLFGNYP